MSDMNTDEKILLEYRRLVAFAKGLQDQNLSAEEQLDYLRGLLAAQMLYGEGNMDYDLHQFYIHGALRVAGIDEFHTDYILFE